jgi:hypothetical protein
MGLYNSLFGHNEHAALVLKLLDLSTEHIGRFRDAFITEDGLAVYTRLGGGNRECYCDNTDDPLELHSCYHQNIEYLQNHPLYLHDADDDFDATYATFYFQFPEEFKEELRKIAFGVHFDPDARWQEMLNSLKGE